MILKTSSNLVYSEYICTCRSLVERGESDTPDRCTWQTSKIVTCLLMHTPVHIPTYDRETAAIFERCSSATPSMVWLRMQLLHPRSWRRGKLHSRHQRPSRGCRNFDANVNESLFSLALALISSHGSHREASSIVDFPLQPSVPTAL